MAEFEVLKNNDGLIYSIRRTEKEVLRLEKTFEEFGRKSTKSITRVNVTFTDMYKKCL